MSVAWKGDTVLLREPPRAVVMRLGGRAGMTAALAAVAVLAPWLVVRTLAYVIVALWLLLLVLGILNVLRSRRVLLVCRGTGAIERPMSIQERWLKRPQEFAAAVKVNVTVYMSPTPSRMDPRVTLSDGTHEVRRVPLWGVDAEEFVAAANGLLQGRGTTLVLVPPSED